MSGFFIDESVKYMLEGDSVWNGYNQLTRPNTKVIDVAFKYAYNSSESFAKAFARFHGITPSQAKKGNELKSFNKLVVKISVEGGTIMDYRIKKKEGFRLLVYAKMFTEESSEKGIPAFWEEYYQNEVYKKAPGYLGICAQEKDGAEEFMYGIVHGVSFKIFLVKICRIYSFFFLSLKLQYGY